VRLPTQPAFETVGAGARRALPISGGTLLVLRGGKIAVASDPDRDRIFVADLGAQRLVAEVRLAPGDQPGRAAEDAAGRVHVVLRGAGEVLTLDPGCWAAAARRPICSAPRGIAFEPARDLMGTRCCVDAGHASRLTAPGPGDIADQPRARGGNYGAARVVRADVSGTRSALASVRPPAQRRKS
jgi:hypothetical protein